MSAASIGGAGLPRAASARRMAAPMSAVGASSAAVATAESIWRSRAPSPLSPLLGT